MNDAIAIIASFISSERKPATGGIKALQTNATAKARAEKTAMPTYFRVSVLILFFLIFIFTFLFLGKKESPAYGGDKGQNRGFVANFVTRPPTNPNSFIIRTLPSVEESHLIREFFTPVQPQAVANKKAKKSSRRLLLPVWNFTNPQRIYYYFMLLKYL